MEVGEKKTVTLPFDQAYGPHNAELVMQFSINQVPEGLNPKIGDKMELGGTDGELMTAIVMDVTKEYIFLDANPPLAGKNLTFALELVEIV